MTAINYIFSLVLAGGGIGTFSLGMSRRKKHHLIQDTPTSKIRSVAQGIAEINGNIEAKETIEAPISKIKCVYYKYEVKEYTRHTHTDSKGHASTSYHWDTISTDFKSLPFSLADETGSLKVIPNGAEVDAPLKAQFYDRNKANIITFLKSFTGVKQDLFERYEGEYKGSAKVGDRKYLEYCLCPKDNLYILGTVEADSSTSHTIKKGNLEKTFMISTKSEKQVLSSLKWQYLPLVIIGAILFALGILLIVLRPF